MAVVAGVLVHDRSQSFSAKLSVRTVQLLRRQGCDDLRSAGRSLTCSLFPWSEPLYRLYALVHGKSTTTTALYPFTELIRTVVDNLRYVVLDFLSSEINTCILHTCRLSRPRTPLLCDHPADGVYPVC